MSKNCITQSAPGVHGLDCGVPQPRIYASANGMSFLTTDTKGDLYRNYGTIARDHYGYKVAVISLRNSTRSDGNNILHLVNKYIDTYRADKANFVAKAKAEKYSKIIAKTIIRNFRQLEKNYGKEGSEIIVDSFPIGRGGLYVPQKPHQQSSIFEIGKIFEKLCATYAKNDSYPSRGLSLFL